MSASDEWMDDETESDEPEAGDENEFRPEGAAFDPPEIADAAEAADQIPLGLNEAEARALDGLFAGTGAAEDVLSDEAPPDAAEPVGNESSPETVPLLDASGNTPADFDELYKALRQWEAAAADAPGDPRFTPKLTTKPRNELLSINRGPHVPFVWLDRSTMTPVKYAGEKPPVDWMPVETDEPRAEQSLEQGQNDGIWQPQLVVRLHRADQHCQDAFEARSALWLRTMRDIADDRVSDERARQESEERAIWGDY